MPTLVQLEIVGKLTTCSTTVRVRNQTIGATVRLFVNGQSAGGGIATWTDQSFPLTNVTLSINSQVTAIQQLAGYTDSPPQNPPASVGPAATPQALSTGAFRAPIHVCSRCVWLYGLFPGATVQVRSGVEVLGSGKAGEDGQVQVELNRSLHSNDALTASLTIACPNNIQSATNITAPAVVALPKLGAIAIEPLLKCAQYIHLTNIVEGAEVTLSKNNTLIKKFNSALSSWYYFPIPKLNAGDIVSAQQDFSCDPPMRSPQGPPSTATVQDVNPSPPVIKPPLCAGKDYIFISGLKPGATVELQIGNNVFTFGASSAFLKVPVPIGLMIDGAVVMVRQNLCGDATTWSAWSPNMTVSTNIPGAPVLHQPQNGATGITVTHPTLTWGDDNGTPCNFATEYEVVVSTDQTVDATGKLSVKKAYEQDSSVPSTKTTTFKVLTAGATYYWQVRGYKKGKPGDWSSVWQFTCAQPNTPSSDPKPGPSTDRWCFIQDCCPFFKNIVSASGASVFEAYETVVNKAPPSCYINPLPVDCKSKPGICGQDSP